MTLAAHRSAASRVDHLEQALHLVALAAVAGMLAAANDILAVDAFRGGTRTFSVLDHAETLRVGAYWLQVGALVIAAVCFIRWQSAALGNLAVLGATPRRSRRGALAAWFVPGLNLVAPKQAIDDLWRSGDPDAPTRSDAAALRQLSAGRLTHAWWGLWLVAWVVGDVAIFASQRATLAQYRAWDLVDLASDVLILVGAVVTITLARAITDRQDARAAGLAQRMHVGLAAGLPPRQAASAVAG